MSARKFEYLGTTDEVTTCDCCGKSNLKKTVVIRDFEGSEELYYGVTCAAKALNVGIKEVKAGTAAADKAKEEAARQVKEEADRARTERWHAHLVARAGAMHDFGGKLDVFAMIQKLGGFKAAQAGFAE
jgi:hypothetical protein